jgi:hypothetical protein
MAQLVALESTEWPQQKRQRLLTDCERAIEELNLLSAPIHSDTIWQVSKVLMGQNTDICAADPLWFKISDEEIMGPLSR